MYSKTRLAVYLLLGHLRAGRGGKFRNISAAGPTLEPADNQLTAPSASHTVTRTVPQMVGLGTLLGARYSNEANRDCSTSRAAL